MRALPSAVLGPEPRPPWNWHFWVLLDLSAGRPHWSPVRLLLAVQRRHWIFPPALNKVFVIMARFALSEIFLKGGFYG